MLPFNSIIIKISLKRGSIMDKHSLLTGLIILILLIGGIVLNAMNIPVSATVTYTVIAISIIIILFYITTRK